MYVLHVRSVTLNQSTRDDEFSQRQSHFACTLTAPKALLRVKYTNVLDQTNNAASGTKHKLRRRGRMLRYHWRIVVRQQMEQQ
jgi:hypothetical protein